MNDLVEVMRKRRDKWRARAEKAEKDCQNWEDRASKEQEEKYKYKLRMMDAERELVKMRIKFRELNEDRDCDNCPSIKAMAIVWDDGINALTDHLDLMVDEFKRIKAISENGEIKDLCDRAITNTKQHVPLIEQRDNAQREALENHRKYYDAIEKNEVMKRCHEAIKDIAENGCRTDLNPTKIMIGESAEESWEQNEKWWHWYIERMDKGMKEKAQYTLDGHW